MAGDCVVGRRWDPQPDPGRDHPVCDPSDWHWGCLDEDFVRVWIDDRAYSGDRSRAGSVVSLLKSEVTFHHQHMATLSYKYRIGYAYYRQ